MEKPYDKPEESQPTQEPNCCSVVFVCFILRQICKGYQFFSNIANYSMYPNQLNIEERAITLRENFQKLHKAGKPSLLRAVFMTFRKSYSLVLFGKTISTALALCVSIFLKFLTSYFQDEDSTMEEGLVFVAILVVLLIVQNMIQIHSVTQGFHLGGLMNMSSLRILIQSFLRFRINTNMNIGKIINIAAADLDAFQFMNAIDLMFVLPFFAIICAVFTYIIVGWSGILAIVILLSCTAFSISIGKCQIKYRLLASKAGDERHSLLSNVIEGMRVVKIQTWEKSFTDKIEELRKREISYLRKVAWFSCANIAVGQQAFSPVLFFTIMIPIWAGQKLTTPEAVGTLAVLFTLQFFLAFAPSIAVTIGSRMFSGGKRITNTLQMESHNPDYALKASGEIAIQLEDLSASWQTAEPNDQEELQVTEGQDEQSPLKHKRSSMDMTYDTLNSIDLTIKKGKLYTIVGPVGSGKSSLLLAILGELNINKGDVAINGTIAYTSQDPWIISGTIKENITMGKAWDPELYAQTILAWALEEDIQQLSSGDETILGDKGINISGGQKARISLARAVYSERDIILMDDPISAVDARVAVFLIQKCFNGILSNRTRILVTHQIAALEYSDHIVVLNKGMVTAQGNYGEISKHEDIIDLVSEYNKNRETKEAKEEKVKVDDKEFEGIVTKEAVNEGFVGLRYYLDYFKAAWGNYCSLVVLFLVGTIVVLIFLAIPYMLVILVEQDDQSDPFYVGIFAALCFGLFLCAWLRNVIIKNILISSSLNLFMKMVHVVLGAKSVFFDSNPSGRIMTRFSTDTYVMDDIFQNTFQMFLDALFLLSGMLIVMIIVSPFTIILVIILITMCIFLLKYIISCGREAKRMELMSKSPLNILITNCASSISSLRAYGYDSMIMEKFDFAMSQIYKAYYNFHNVYKAFNMYMSFAFGLFLTLNVLVLVLIRDMLATDLIIMTLSYITLIMSLIQVFGRTASEMLSMMPSVQRIIDYHALDQEPDEGDKGFKVTHGELEFCDTWMKYQENLDFSLRGLTFEIPSGSKVGIVGRTGAGKSTIMQILLRLTELHSGEILIDGQNIAKVKLSDLRKQIDVIQQVPMVFADTVRYNLDPFEEYSDKDIWDALEDVQLKAHFEELPDGLKTVLDDKKFQLSVGQKQLMCLGRAVLRKSKILLLDEATANVDVATEQLLQQKVAEKFGNCTVIAIAHRINTVIDSDIIVVLGNGAVLEQGSPQELLANPDSEFYKMKAAFDEG